MDHWKLLSRCGFLQAQSTAVNARKSVRIVLYLASDTVRWQEDKYTLQQQQYASKATNKYQAFVDEVNYALLRVSPTESTVLLTHILEQT